MGLLPPSFCVLCSVCGSLFFGVLVNRLCSVIAPRSATADVFCDGGRFLVYSFLHRRRLVTRFARNIYRRYAGLGPSRIRTRIASTRSTGVASQNSSLPCAITTFPVSLLPSPPGDV